VHQVGRIHHPAHHAASHRPFQAKATGSGFAALLGAHAAAEAPEHAADPACHGSLQSHTKLGAYVGRSAGSGQCVALVRAAIPGLGPTAHWVRGAAVKGNHAIPPGTPIATFSHTGHYANATDGSSHAAIYLGQNDEGVQVLDQWAGRAAAVRTIPWNHPGAVAANTGAAFHVVDARSAVA
jgi:hypothetical protein